MILFRLISPPEALLKDEKASLDLVDEPNPEVKDFLTRIDNFLKGSEEKQEEALENLINKKDEVKGGLGVRLVKEEVGG